MPKEREERRLSRRDQEKEASEDVRGWFKDHVGTLISDTHLRWAKPGSGYYALDFLIKDNFLIVVGDGDDAIYAWSQRLTFEWVAHCDLGYFHGKCMASPAGRRFRTWDPDVARHYLHEYFDDRDRNGADCTNETCPECRNEEPAVHTCERCENWGTVEVPTPDPQRAEFEELDGWDTIQSDFEWSAFLREHGHDVFGDDYFEMSPGWVTSTGCIAHLEGLKMAVAQLAAKAAA